MPPPTLGSCKLHGHRHLASQSAGPRPKVTSGDLEKGFPRARGRHCRAHCCPQARALGRADMPRTPQGGQGQVQGQRVQGAPTAATQRWEGQRARGAHSVDLQVVDPAEVQLAVCRRVLWRKAQPVVQGQHPAGHLGTGQWPRASTTYRGAALPRTLLRVELFPSTSPGEGPRELRVPRLRTPPTRRPAPSCHSRAKSTTCPKVGLVLLLLPLIHPAESWRLRPSAVSREPVRGQGPRSARCGSEACPTPTPSAPARGASACSGSPSPQLPRASTQLLSGPRSHSKSSPFAVQPATPRCPSPPVHPAPGAGARVPITRLGRQGTLPPQRLLASRGPALAVQCDGALRALLRAPPPEGRSSCPRQGSVSAGTGAQQVRPEQPVGLVPLALPG